MKKFYLGMESIRITQDYNGGTSHYNHSHGSPADYPIDLAGCDGGQSVYFAPVDMKVTAIKGVGSSVTNTIWLVSTEKVKTPTFEDVVFMSLTHWNDNAMKWKVGDIIKAGEIITWEGTDGADGNHLHCAYGRGYCDDWTENSNGSWVNKGNNKKPEEVCYIYDNFSKVLDTKGINFEHTDNLDYDENFLPPRGWYQEGDSGEEVSILDDFYAGEVLGDYFGTYTKYLTMAFQTKYKVVGGADGNIGINTYNKMIEEGLDPTTKPSSSYYKVGDSGENIAKINSFLASKVYGDYYGTFTKYGTMALQEKGKEDGVYNDKIDGCFGAKSLNTAEYYGFTY